MTAKRQVIAVGGPPTFRPQLARALKANPEAIEWVANVTAAEAAVDKSVNPYELLVLSPLVDEAEAAAIARSLTRSSPTTAVIVARERPIDGALPRLIRAGVRDVVDLSRGADELEEALAQALAWSASVRRIGSENGEGRPRGTIVSVFSTKGGTGKTFLATNLSAAIAERSGAPTAIIDLDLDLGDVFAYFGREPRRSLPELVVEVARAADSGEIAELGTPLGEHLTGFGSPPDPSATSISTEAMGEVMRTMRTAFRHTIVDATCDFTDHVIATLELSDHILLITGLDVISVRHLSLGMRTLDNLGIPRDRMHVVLNRADSKVELTAKDIESALGISVEAQIPSSSVVPRSINRSALLWYDESRSPVAKSIGALADQLLEASPAPQARPQGSARQRGRNEDGGRR